MVNEKASVFQFALKGFSQDQETRRFTFERVEADQTRTEFIVSANLTLARAHGIRVQELPLLCRELLDRRVGPDGARIVNFTEEDMRALSAGRAAAQQAAAQKRKPPRKPAAGSTGSAWRTAVSTPSTQP